MRLPNRFMENILHRPGLCWIVSNIIGLYLVNINYFRMIYRSISGEIPHYPLSVIGTSIISAFIFGLFHLVFFGLFTNREFSIHWFLRTLLSFLFVLFMNLYIIPVVIFPWLMPLLSAISVPTGNYLDALSGIVISARGSDMFFGFPIACVLGAIIGGFTGLIFGFFQASLITDRKLARAWVISSTVSFCIGFTIWSAFFTITNFILQTNIIERAPHLSHAFMGLFYGLGTWKTVEKILTISEMKTFRVIAGTTLY